MVNVQMVQFLNDVTFQVTNLEIINFGIMVLSLIVLVLVGFNLIDNWTQEFKIDENWMEVGKIPTYMEEWPEDITNTEMEEVMVEEYLVKMADQFPSIGRERAPYDIYDSYEYTIPGTNIQLNEWVGLGVEPPVRQ